MNVYLVQHAQAKTEQEDPERPLSEKGQTDINKAAAFIAKSVNISRMRFEIRATILKTSPSV